MKDALRIVTGCLRPTPADNLPILTGIQPAELRRNGATLSLARRGMEPGHLLHSALTNSPSADARRFRSRRPFILLLEQIGYGLLCGLWAWRRRTNRRPCGPPMSNSSTSSWTARPDGSGRWDNWMAAQYLSRYQVRPSSGLKNWLQRRSSRVWNNHHLTIKLKVRAYSAYVLSVLLYSSETWCTFNHQENRLNAFHFRCLRSILGVTCSNHVPNSTILHITGSYDLITIMRHRRLRWLGHVHRMEDDCMPKDILYGVFYNAPRRTGRPKLRYKDVIKRDMAGFHISPQSWETLAADRNQWPASLSDGYSFAPTKYVETVEKCRAHRRQRRDGP